MKDMFNDIETRVAIEAQALSGTSDLTGQIIDRQGFESVTFVVSADAIAAADLDTLLNIEDGDDSGLSDAAAVADADLIGTEANTAIADTDDKVSKRIGYKGGKRFVRANLTVTNNDGTDVFSGICILGHANVMPVTAN